MTFPGEQVFENEVSVRFVLQPATTHPKSLCVTFAGMRREPKYTYVRTLDPVGCHKLFVLDDFGPTVPGYGRPGCYYLGAARDFHVERSVRALIGDVSKDLQVAPREVIGCGSSKGGWAALYYGLKYGFGQLVVGAPQSRLGRYLMHGKFTELGRFIAGDSDDDPEPYLDSLLFDVIRETPYRPCVHVHVGSRERHRWKHVEPLLAALGARGIPFDLDLADYEHHDEVSRFFPPYLSRTVLALVGTAASRPAR